jgi:predicted PurR-regulated permease PerM
MGKISSSSSPQWGSNTKLVITLTLVVILGAIIVRFKFVIGPVLIAFLLAYLLLPLASSISKRTPLSWAIAVNLIYLIIILFLLSLLTWGGMGLVGQVMNLITAIQNYANQLPAIIENVSHNAYIFGPFKFDFSTIDWQTIGQQILSYIEPALGKMGNLVGSLATGAVSTVGWIVFVVIVSYFFLLESGGLRSGIIHVDIPGYTEDFHRLSNKSGRIWSTFLRGQAIIFLLKVVTYTVIMSIVGVHYAIGIALIAGFATFLPYIGPAINWVVLGLVTYFQGSNPFGFSPLFYTVFTIILALVIDQVFDNLVSPRIIANTLKVHPAFVLIAAIIAANLIGPMGIFIAAPLLATLQLFGRYTVRKLMDHNPWPPEEDILPPSKVPKWFQKFIDWWQKRKSKNMNSVTKDIPKS